MVYIIEHISPTEICFYVCFSVCLSYSFHLLTIERSMLLFPLVLL